MIRDTAAQDRPLTPAATRRPWVRKAVVAAVVVGALVAIGFVLTSWFGAQRAVSRARIRIATVERGTLTRDVVADGRIVAANSPTLYAIAAGTVDFLVRPGDEVKKGQAIATIASPALQSLLRQEQATLAGLEANVGRAGLDVDHGRANAQKLIAQAEVDRKAAAREVEIDTQMVDKGVIPELELRRAEDVLEKAKISLSHAKTEAGLAGKELAFDLGTRQQSLDRQREIVSDLVRQVGELQITSPVEGQIGQLLVPQRATVAANAPVMSVVDLGAFELEIRVPDAYARDLAFGMSAEIRSGNRTFAGRVRSVSPEVVEGNVATRIELVGQRPEGLRQNQRLTARILIEERPNVLKVERGPFLESGGGNTAYFMTGDIAERRTITTGAVSVDSVELLSGAKPGDQVVVSGTDTFNDAERVRISD